MCNFHRSHSLHVKHCRKNTLYHVARYCLFPDLHIECEHIYLFYSWIRRLNWNITKILHTNYVNRSPRLSRCWNRSWPESTPASRSKECWILLKDELNSKTKKNNWKWWNSSSFPPSNKHVIILTNLSQGCVIGMCLALLLEFNKIIFIFI